MLTAIRDRVGGWVASAIFIFISIPFALWGIESYFKGGGPQVVATVNGTDIPVNDFNQQLQLQKRQLAQMFGGKIPKGQINDADIKAQVLESMIRDEVLLQELDHAGYGVSDETLLRRIKSVPMFQTSGQFDRGRYAQILASQRRSEAEFEASLKQEIRYTEFTEGVTNTAFATSADLALKDRLQDQKRSYAFLQFKLDSAKSASSITQQAIEQRYAEAKDRYQTPERVKVEYVEVAQKDLMNKISVDEQALKVQYEQGGEELLLSPEKRSVRHILLKLPEAPKPEDAKKFKQDADDLVRQLRGGADFAKLATERSSDSLSAKSGGLLGQVKKGDLDPRLDAAVFALDKGQISDPVFTGSAFEIVKVDEITPAVRQSFEQAHDRLAADYKQRQAESRFAELSEKLLTTSFEQADSLNASADAVGASIQTSDWMTRENGEGVATQPAVREAAFSPEVVDQKRNSDLIELADGRVLVLRLAEHQKPETKPLEAVKDDIRQELAVEVALKQAQSQVQAAATKLRAGTSIEAIAKEQGAELKSVTDGTRAATDNPAKVIERVFAMPRPQGGNATVDTVQLSDGGYAVIQLTAVTDGKPSASPQPDALSAEYGKREFASVVDALRVQAKVKVSQDESQQ